MTLLGRKLWNNIGENVMQYIPIPATIINGLRWKRKTFGVDKLEGAKGCIESLGALSY